mgnify:CR=1 FL=1
MGAVLWGGAVGGVREGFHGGSRVQVGRVDAVETVELMSDRCAYPSARPRLADAHAHPHS